MTEQTENLYFENIKYRNKKVDYGYIIGTRARMYLARRYKYPLWAKIGKDFVSECVYRKRSGCTFYVPARKFKAGIVIILFDSMKIKKPVRFRIMNIENFCVKVKFMQKGERA